MTALLAYSEMETGALDGRIGRRAILARVLRGAAGEPAVGSPLVPVLRDVRRAASRSCSILSRGDPAEAAMRVLCATLGCAGPCCHPTSRWYTQHKASTRTRRAGSRHYPRRLHPRWPLLSSGDAGLSSRSGRPSQTRSLRRDARGESDGLGSPTRRGHGFFSYL